MEITIVLVLLALVLVFFTIGKLSVDTITLGMLTILLVTGILTPSEAFAGFGSDFIWMLASLFVISGALQQTGVIDLLGSRLLKQARVHPGWLVTWIMTTVGFTSAFLNNTTVTAIYLAPVISVARRLKISPSKLLMPVAYASILGGTCTLIGTSTNIAVSGYLVKSGFRGVGMFDTLPIGITLFVVGMLYMVIVGKRLLPDRGEETFSEEFGLREYVSEIVVTQDSTMLGQLVFRSTLQGMGFRVLNILRNSENILPDQNTLLHGGDVLLVEGNVNSLMDIKEIAGVEIRADAFIDRDLQSDRIRLAEVLITPQSNLVNNTLQHVRFRHEYDLVVLAIKRQGHPLLEKIGKTPLRVGDVLLVQGEQEHISYHKRVRELNILEDFKPLLYRKKKGLICVSVFSLAVLSVITGVLPVSVAFLLAAILMVASKAITISKSYDSIDFRLLVLIAGMTAMGTAMTKTGAAQWITRHMLDVLQPYGLMAIMTGLTILTVFLTQPLSNAAAALVMMPIAIDAAHQMQVDPHPFAMAVMLSASVSLVTPFEPSCLLVYSPGRYRFMDFFKTGFLLTLVLMLILVWMIPLYWSF